VRAFVPLLVAPAVVLSALAVSAAAASPLAPPVAALPVLGEIAGSTPVVLRGRVPAARVASLLATARGVHADVTRRFLSGRTAPPVQVCLFTTDAEYGAFVHDDFPGLPAWLNEGIGALYGTSRVTGDGVTFLVNYRLRDLRRAIRTGALPDLAGLAHATGSDVYGDRSAVYYAMARYVLLYLERHGRLELFYRAVRDGPHDADTIARLLEEAADLDAFLTWVRALK
jgi:hypothetical protein